MNSTTSRSLVSISTKQSGTDLSFLQCSILQGLVPYHTIFLHINDLHSVNSYHNYSYANGCTLDANIWYTSQPRIQEQDLRIVRIETFCQNSCVHRSPLLAKAPPLLILSDQSCPSAGKSTVHSTQLSIQYTVPNS